jgi:hypothetical protein
MLSIITIGKETIGLLAMLVSVAISIICWIAAFYDKQGRAYWFKQAAGVTLIIGIALAILLPVLIGSV